MSNELSPMRRLLALAMLAMALICEGFDVMAASFAAPDVMEDFGVEKAELGFFLTASALGMLVGSAFLGGLGDKIGRRPMVIAGTAGYSAVMLISTLSSSLWELTLARFVIGVFVGALLPNAIILAGELGRESMRARMSALITLGISLGATLAGVAAAILLPAYGWRGLFLLGGVVPLLFCFVLWAALPESPAFGRAQPEHRSLGWSPAPLFRRELRGMTVAIWLIVILLSMTLYLLSSWTPVLLAQSGLGERQASLVAGIYHFGGIFGGLLAAVLLGRSGWITLAAFLALASMALLFVSLGSSAAVMLVVGMAASGAFVVGSQTAFNGLAASAYPLGVRASGFGWALGISRLGSVSGPIVGAAFIQLGFSDPQSLFMLPVLPLLVAASAATWLGLHMRRTSRG